MARQFEDQVAIVGVASRDAVGPMEEFVARHDLAHVPNAADVDGAVWERFGVTGQPAWVFVDGETGETTRTFGLSEADLVERLDALAAN